MAYTIDFIAWNLNESADLSDLKMGSQMFGVYRAGDCLVNGWRGDNGLFYYQPKTN